MNDEIRKRIDAVRRADADRGRAGEQYEILEKAGIPVLIMEPLKGGSLATLTDEARAILRAAVDVLFVIIFCAADIPARHGCQWSWPGSAE